MGIVNKVSETLLSLVFSIIFWPIALLVWICTLTVREFVTILLKLFWNDKYELMKGNDSVFFYRGKNNLPGPYLSFYLVINGKPSLNKIKEKFQKGLKVESFKRLTKKLTQKFGFNCWEKVDNFCLDNHVKIMDGIDPHEIMNLDKINNYISQISNREIKPVDQPQWEFLLIPNKFRIKSKTGIDGLIEESLDNFSVIFRLNHFYCDGISLIMMLNEILADAPCSLPIDPMKPLPVSNFLMGLFYLKTIIYGPLNFAKNLIRMVKDENKFSAKSVSPDYPVSYARSPAFSMKTLKNIKKASDVSISAILYTSITATLQKYYQRLYPEEQIPEFLNGTSIVAMLPYPNSSLQNRFTIIPFRIPFNFKINNYHKLLKDVFSIAKNINTGPDPLFNFYLGKIVGNLPVYLSQKVLELSSSPVLLSNIPGLSNPLNIFDGVVVEFAGFIPLISIGIGISVQSYCDNIRMTVSADPLIFKPAILQSFVDDIVKNILTLEKLSATSSLSSYRPISDINGNYVCRG